MAYLPIGTDLYQSNQAQSSFKIPGAGNEKYWMKVAKSGPNKGKIEVWNSQILDDRRIGVLDPKTGKWDFNEAPLGIGV